MSHTDSEPVVSECVPDETIGGVRTEVRKLLKQNSQALLGLAPSKKGDLLYRTPADWLAVGLFLEWTELDSFYLNAIALPLFVPYSVVSLSVGDRLPLPNSSMRAWPPRWRPELGEADEQLLKALQSALSSATHLLDRIGSVEGYVQFLNRNADPKKSNPLFQEEAAYSGLLMGRSFRGARRDLEAVLNVVEDRKSDHWEVNGKVTYRSPDQFQEVAERVNTVITRMDEGGDPVQQLRAWRQERVRHLGLVRGATEHPDLPERRSTRLLGLRSAPR